MKQATINKLFQMITPFSISLIAGKVSEDFGEDFEFSEENHSNALKYLKSKCLPEFFKDEKSEITFVESIGRLVAIEKMQETSRVVADDLESLTKKYVFLDLDDELYETFLFPAQDQVSELLVNLKN